MVLAVATRRLPLLTEQDGEEFVRLLNEVIEITSKTLMQDVYLHYRDGSGWRARIGGSDATAWVGEDGPWAGLLDALRAEMKPIRKQLAQPSRRRTTKRREA